MKGNPITRETFESLLEWLDTDRVRAGRKYEDIRLRLVKIFMSRGCIDAENLADETINRVASKVSAIKESYIGDPALYFYGVARNVLMEDLRAVQHMREEYTRRAVSSSYSFQTDESESAELEHRCLHNCLDTLDSDKRELILHYYRGEKRGRIDSRRELSAQMGINPSLLRKRVERIRMALEDCVIKCISQNKV